jgi:alpha-N-arabinofuranosidase
MVLNPAIDSPRYDCKDFTGVSLLEAAAVHDEERGDLTIFAVNRSAKEPLELAGDLRGFPPLSVVEHLVLENPDPKAVNTATSEKVKPRSGGGAKIDGTRLDARLPALSWNVIRLRPAPS